MYKYYICMWDVNMWLCLSRSLIISAKFEHFSLISLGEFIADIPHLDVIESLISCMKCAYLQFHSHTLVCENCYYNSCNVKIVPFHP